MLVQKAVSRAFHPDHQDKGDAVKACDGRLKRFNAAFDTLMNGEPGVIGWCSLPVEERGSALLAELWRWYIELQQLREELAKERQERTKRWDISAR